MRTAFNPFLVSVAVALLALVAIMVLLHRRTETWALTAANRPRTTSSPSVPATLALVAAVAVLLVPFGIAFAALCGPSVGILVWSALLAGGLTALAVSRRSHG